MLVQYPYAPTQMLLQHIFCDTLPSYRSLNFFFFISFLPYFSLNPFRILARSSSLTTSLASLLLPTLLCLLLTCFLPCFPVDSFVAPNKCFSPVLWVSLGTYVGDLGRENFSQLSSPMKLQQQLLHLQWVSWEAPRTLQHAAWRPQIRPSSIIPQLLGGLLRFHDSYTWAQT